MIDSLRRTTDGVQQIDGPSLVIAAVRGMLREADPEAGDAAVRAAVAVLGPGG